MHTKQVQHDEWGDNKCGTLLDRPGKRRQDLLYRNIEQCYARVHMTVSIPPAMVYLVQVRHQGVTPLPLAWVVLPREDVSCSPSSVTPLITLEDALEAFFCNAPIEAAFFLRAP